jgi:hypothetical protein
MTTFDQWAGEQHFREMDVEISHWGDVNINNKNNAQYGIEPFYVPGNLSLFKAPAGLLTHSMRWESGRVKFTTVRGGGGTGNGHLVSEHEFTSGVPSPGQEKVQLFFYVVASDKNPLQKDEEIVVEKFEYLP